LITNRLGLPEALVNAVANDDYSAGDCDISVTSLISPPQMRFLKKKHAGEISEDVSDCIWRLIGQAVHSILERADSTDLREERLYADIEGWRVSGKFDNIALEDGHLSDYKVTSVYAVKGDAKPEWEAQLNCLAYLCRVNNYAISSLSITAILRDWNKYGRMKQDDYPPQNVVVIPVNMWPDNDALIYMAYRVKLHQLADSGIQTLCTDEERWHVPDKWALMTKGKTRAIRLFDSLAEIEKVTLAKDQYIEHRPGEDKRCELYCSVNKFCPQLTE